MHPRCPIPCYLTQDKRALSVSDAVLFFTPLVDWQAVFMKPDPVTRDIGKDQLAKQDDANYPTEKKSGQVWAMYNSEPQWTQYKKFGYPEFEAQFDVELTFRLNGTIPSPYFVGYMPFLRAPSTKSASAPVLFMAGRCDTQNNRTGYVQELMKCAQNFQLAWTPPDQTNPHPFRLDINVHSYGKCLNNKQMPWYAFDKFSAKQHLMKRYKFYLAFENSNEDYYVTEKFFGGLIAGTVPVVMGWKDVARVAPHPKSFIHVNDFESPKALAEYLLELDANPGS
jgi:hypothetical protein